MTIILDLVAAIFDTNRDARAEALSPGVMCVSSDDSAADQKHMKINKRRTDDKCQMLLPKKNSTIRHLITHFCVLSFGRFFRAEALIAVKNREWDWNWRRR